MAVMPYIECGARTRFLLAVVGNAVLRLAEALQQPENDFIRDAAIQSVARL